MPRTIAFILATLATAATTCPAHAQTTTVPRPDGEWRGALGVGGTITSGNTDSVNYAVNGDIVRQTSFDKVSGYAQAVNGRREENGATIRTADQARAGVAYTRDSRESD